MDVRRSLCKHGMCTNMNVFYWEKRDGVYNQDWVHVKHSLIPMMEPGTEAIPGQPGNVTGKWNRIRLGPSYIHVLVAIFLMTSTESSNPLSSASSMPAGSDLILDRLSWFSNLWILKTVCVCVCVCVCMCVCVCVCACVCVCQIYLHCRLGALLV